MLSTPEASTKLRLVSWLAAGCGYACVYGKKCVSPEYTSLLAIHHSNSKLATCDSSPCYPLSTSHFNCHDVAEDLGGL